jgi:hypothetical protein
MFIVKANQSFSGMVADIKNGPECSGPDFLFLEHGLALDVLEGIEDY